MIDRNSTLLARLQAVADEALPDRERLSAQIGRREFVRGEMIFRQGEVCGALHAIASGIVKLAYDNASGRQFTKALLEEESIFASIAALQGKHASFNAIALTDVTLEHVSWRVFEALCAAHHSWERTMRLLSTEQALRKEQREFELLTLTASQRWQRLQATRPELVKRVAQSELAALIGVTPVALSRLKARASR